MCSAFNNILDKFKLPYLALPFNIIATVSFMALQAFYEDTEDNGKSFYQKRLQFLYITPLYYTNTNCVFLYSDSVEIPAIDTDVMRFKFENISTSTSNEGLVYAPSSELCPVPSEHEGVNWQMVGKGIALSMGQGIPE